MSVPSLNPYTFANRASQAPNSIPELFSRFLERSTGGVGDPFEQFIGPDGAMGFPVVRKTDLQSSAGQLVHFTKHGALMAKGKRGEAELRGNEEKLRYGTDSVKIDFVRHASSFTRKDLAFSAPGKKIPLAKVEAAAHSSNPKMRKKGQFALNVRK
mgnify:CR=1 FL=1